MPIVVPVAIGVAGIVEGTAADTVKDTAAGIVKDTAAGIVKNTPVVGTVVGTVAGTLGFAACNPCLLLLLSVVFVYHCTLPVHPLRFKLNIVTK